MIPFSCGELTFARPDLDTFPCLRLAMEAVQAGGTACAVLNRANETAVSLFLQNRIVFGQIPELLDAALQRLGVVQHPDLAEILHADAQAREAAMDAYHHLVKV